MPIAGRILAGFKPVLRRGIFRCFGRGEEGATAIEFALVATPFFMFVFGLIGCSLYFFTMSSLEKGMDQASRLVRTGEAVTEKLTVKQFRQLICDGSGSWIDCSKLKMVTQPFDAWSGGDDPAAPWLDQNGNPPYSCTANTVPPSEVMQDSDPIALHTGGASQIVLVTTCYKWDLAAKLPFLRLGNSLDGSMMMQTATAFRSEPYPTSE